MSVLSPLNSFVQPSPSSDSSTPTATTPTPLNTNQLNQLNQLNQIDSSHLTPSSSSFNSPKPKIPSNSNLNSNSTNIIPNVINRPPQNSLSRLPHLRPLRRMSSTGTQLKLDSNLVSSCSDLGKRINPLGLESNLSKEILDDIIIGGECGLIDGGKNSSGNLPPNSESWIAHHLSAVLQHSFAVSSFQPINNFQSSHPSYYHNSTPQNHLSSLLLPDTLRNKTSITSLSSFTPSSTSTDDDDDDEIDEIDETEEAQSQVSASSSYSFSNSNSNSNQIHSSLSIQSTFPNNSSSPTISQFDSSHLTSLPSTSTSRPILLKILSTWSFDANSLSPLQIRTSLHIMLSVYLNYTPGFLSKLQEIGLIDPQESLKSLVNNLEVAYDSRNSYHNFRHAVDVVQAIYTILSFEGIVPSLSWVLKQENDSSSKTVWKRSPIGKIGHLLDEMTIWALLLAAAGHDVGHPGLSNAFMVNARTPIAYVFSDGAVLENFHKITFTRMLREHGYGKVLDNHHGFRQVLVGSVLATDMGRHFPIVEELKRLASKWDSIQNDLSIHQNDVELLSEKVLITAGLIKCGDISNSSRPHHISLTWSSCLLDEWSRQAALETNLQLPISVVTLDPTEKRAQAKSQVGFTTLFALPLFTVMEQLSPKAFRPFADNCRTGLKTWQAVVECIDINTNSLKRNSNSNLTQNILNSSKTFTHHHNLKINHQQLLDSSPLSPNSIPSNHSSFIVPCQNSPLSLTQLKSDSSHHQSSIVHSNPSCLSSQDSNGSNLNSSIIDSPRLKENDDTHSTPKPNSKGWWLTSSSQSNHFNLNKSSFISSNSIWNSNNSINQTSSLNHPSINLSSPCNLENSHQHHSSLSNQNLNNNSHQTLTIQLSHSNQNHSISTSLSSDESKTNSINDDSSLSSLGSPLSPPRSPYSTPGVSSTSSIELNKNLKPPILIVNSINTDKTMDQKTLDLNIDFLENHLSASQRPRDKGMSVDFGLSRRTTTRSSLPFRKKSYSPFMVNQQVACARGCGKVTVKCVKCAAKSKIKMYRSLSIAKTSFQMRSEYIPGLRYILGQNSNENKINLLNHHHDQLLEKENVKSDNRSSIQSVHFSNSLSQLHHPSNSVSQSPTSLTQESIWPPYPFRPF
ncbi:hypothetical protein O181_063316 [Austropuccinia psidii MF-1]|uniref:Phosphodiesterase n=1 Tax=Austropuccinia psidii MF-1 TaxID=1389203 RepID=A0A9Q3HZB5_9BASI|nr:hypothetical protein [Austropuccinia psidii MF-1]